MLLHSMNHATNATNAIWCALGIFGKGLVRPGIITSDHLSNRCSMPKNDGALRFPGGLVGDLNEIGWWKLVEIYLTIRTGQWGYPDSKVYWLGHLKIDPTLEKETHCVKKNIIFRFQPLNSGRVVFDFCCDVFWYVLIYFDLECFLHILLHHRTRWVFMRLMYQWLYLFGVWGRRTNLHHLHSLKLTLRTWKKVELAKETIVFQGSIF